MTEDSNFNKKTIQELLNESKIGSKVSNMSESRINYVIANSTKAQDPLYQEKMKEIQSSQEYTSKVSDTSKQKWKDPNFREKNTESKKRAWTNDAKRKEKVIEQFSQPKTKTHKNNIGKALKDFNQTQEGQALIKARSDAQRGIPRKVVICPHCNKEGGEGIMIRWHFDNCKHKK